MRRLATVILVLLVVLAAGGAVADRVIVSRTEDRLLAEARDQLELADDAEVEIDGFPFLTQVLADRLSEVRATSSTLVLDGLELRDVRAAARGVTPDEPYPAETVEINAQIPVATLRTVLGRELGMQTPPALEVVDGRLRFGVEVADLGPSFGLSIQVDPELTDGGIVLRLGEVEVGGTSVPAELVGVLDDLLSDVPLEIPGLPEGLEPTRLSVGDDGVDVRLEGTDVELGAWVG